MCLTLMFVYWRHTVIKLTTELTLNVTQTYFFITLEYFHMDGCSGKRMHGLCINV